MALLLKLHRIFFKCLILVPFIVFNSCSDGELTPTTPKTDDVDFYNCTSDEDGEQIESDFSTGSKSYLVDIVKQTKEVADEIMGLTKDSFLSSLKLIYSQRFPSQDDKQADKIKEHIKDFEEVEEHGKQLLDEIQKSTEQFANNAITLNDFLFKILRTRCGVIYSRQRSNTSSLNEQEKSSSASDLFHDLPINELLLEAILKNDTLFKDWWFNQGLKDHHSLQSGYSVVVFQICNLLIKKVLPPYNFQTYKEVLTKETMCLLRASRQLHPILAGTQQDLGTPDDACPPWGLLKPILLSHYGYVNNNNNNSMEQLKAISRLLVQKRYTDDDQKGGFRIASLIPKLGHIYSVLDEIRRLPSYEWSKKAKSASQNIDALKEEMKSFEYKRTTMIHQQKLKNLEKLQNDYKAILEMTEDQKLALSPEASYLKALERDLDYTWLRDFFTEKGEYITQERYSSSLPEIGEAFQLGASWYLPAQRTLGEEVAFTRGKGRRRHKPKPKSRPKKPSTNSIAIPVGAGTENGKTEDGEKVTGAGEELGGEEDLVSASEEEMGSEAGTEDGEEVTGAGKAIGVEEDLVSASGEEMGSEAGMEDGEAVGGEEVKNCAYLLPNDPQFDFNKHWVPAKGLRLFHPESLKKPHPVLSELKQHYQRTVNQLFNSQTKQSVTFKDFAALWTGGIKGSIIGENNGGGHRQLIGPLPGAEKLIGIFIFNPNIPHPSIIGYLQTAVLYVGCRPQGNGL